MVHRRKLKTNGTIDKCKARLVAKGYKQITDIDFFDKYSPITRLTFITVVTTMAAIHKLTWTNHKGLLTLVMGIEFVN